MIEVIPFETLGRFDIDWLSARYHFSFAEYHDPHRMGFGPLRVWNEDTIQPGQGFPPHPHRDMEIITYVRTGAITHEDHLGNRGRTAAGDVQVMSAGRGIVHSEYNLEDTPTQIFQIWIRPDRPGHAPRWDTRTFPKGDRAGQLVVLASGREVDRDKDALLIHQDAALLGATLRPGDSVTHVLAPGRRAYLVPARGRLEVNGRPVGARDGVKIADEPAVTIRALEDSEVLMADLP